MGSLPLVHLAHQDDDPRRVPVKNIVLRPSPLPGGRRTSGSGGGQGTTSHTEVVVGGCVHTYSLPVWGGRFTRRPAAETEHRPLLFSSRRKPAFLHVACVAYQFRRIAIVT